MAQITNSILMIRPTTFRANEQTAANNYYQKTLDHIPTDSLLQLAQKEFDNFVVQLREKGG